MAFTGCAFGCSLSLGEGEQEFMSRLSLLFLCFLFCSEAIGASLNPYLIKAEAGDPDSQYEAGHYHYVRQEYTDALTWLRHAAGNGQAQAQNDLGRAYTGDFRFLVAVNYIEAEKWLLASARQGYVKGQSNLGEFYERQGDYGKAALWYRLAAIEGDLNAKENLASLFLLGKGVEKNPTEAARLAREPAIAGFRDSQSLLGNAYLTGAGVPSNYVEAANWNQAAAEQGDARAQYNLGLAYNHGKGVLQNYKQSIKWLLKSSNQGFGPALTMLSACYLEGRGVEKNVVLAHMYSNLAAYHRGDAWSLKSLSTVTDMLTPEQLVTSQKMARKWLEAKE